MRYAGNPSVEERRTMSGFVAVLAMLFLGCGGDSDAVSEASCSEDALASLQRTCVELGGDFSATTTASELDECGISGSGGATGGSASGECKLQGEGACEVV